MIDLDRLNRWHATTRTWAGKTAALSRNYSGDSAPARVLVGFEAARTANVLLDAVELLFTLVDDEYDAADIEKAVTELRSLVRSRRLATQLEQTEGRTPEEAETYLEAAVRIRGARESRGRG